MEDGLQEYSISSHCTEAGHEGIRANAGRTTLIHSSAAQVFWIEAVGENSLKAGIFGYLCRIRLCRFVCADVRSLMVSLLGLQSGPLILPTMDDGFPELR